MKVQVAISCARGFPEELSEVLAENETTNLEAPKRKLPISFPKKRRKTEMFELLPDEDVSLADRVVRDGGMIFRRFGSLGSPAVLFMSRFCW